MKSWHAIVLAFPMCAGAVAQVSGAAPLVQDRITLNGEMELARLVDLAAKRLNLDVEYDAAGIKGTVTIRVGGELTNEELWALTNELLAARGFATVMRPGGKVVSVVKVADAPGSARLESGAGDATAELPGAGALPGGRGSRR